jgi:hypothetical protein
MITYTFDVAMNQRRALLVKKEHAFDNPDQLKATHPPSEEVEDELI